MMVATGRVLTDEQVREEATAKARRQRRIEELRSPLAYTNRHHECDLVMKGGITSAVVYPIAISELATDYRFRNIGGTSAGAIAAAAAAAASLDDTGHGFAKLARLPDRLGTELLDVFRPQRSTRALMKLLVAFTEKPSTKASRFGKLASRATIWAKRLVLGLSLLRKPRGLLLGLLILSPLVVGIVALAAADAPVLLKWIGLIMLGFATLLGLLVAIAAAVMAEAVTKVPKNKYGLVGGGSARTRPRAVAALSDWLHILFQDLAGRAPDDKPVTWGDLQSHDINLTLLTTSISEGRTNYLPLDLDAGEDDADQGYFFDPIELRTVLSDRVIAFMCEPDDAAACATAYEQIRRGKLPERRIDDEWIAGAFGQLWPLPRPENFPIVVATRMSLSFPILLSAVPLRKVDWTLDANNERRVQWRDHFKNQAKPASERSKRVVKPSPINAEPCWFSDGGIISNFPIHLFDRALPSRPTFGINLRPFHPDHETYADPAFDEAHKIFRPQKNNSGLLQFWSRWEPSGWRGIVGFVSAILGTMQNWSDNDQQRLPGYRDRIVHVSHSHDEGGLNLSMPPEVIETLGARGQAAAEELATGFLRPTAEVDTTWHNHRWIRLRSAADVFSEELGEMIDQYEQADTTGVPTYAEMLHEDAADPSYDVTDVHRLMLREMVEGVYEDPSDDYDAAPGFQGLVDAVRKRSGDRVTADPSYEGPSPRARLRIMPGHRDGT